MDRLLEMSPKELSRLEVMQRLSRKQMSQKEAGTILKLECAPDQTLAESLS